MRDSKQSSEALGLVKLRCGTRGASRVPRLMSCAAAMNLRIRSTICRARLEQGLIVDTCGLFGPTTVDSRIQQGSRKSEHLKALLHIQLAESAPDKIDVPAYDGASTRQKERWMIPQHGQ